MKKESIIFIFLIALFILTQNVYPQSGKAAFYPNMYDNRQATILIMPILKRTNTDYSVGKITVVNEVLLANNGYYVMPSSILNNLIIRDSLECLPDINPEPCRVFHDRFGIDALLFIAFKNTTQGISQSSPYNELEYSLVSSSTGKELWYYDVKVNNETQTPDVEFPNTSSFCADMFCGFTGIFFAALITSGLTYDRNIERASKKAINKLPAGKYQSNFLLDSLDKINVKAMWRNQKFGDRSPIETN
jgi:hypothetical protein